MQASRVTRRPQLSFMKYFLALCCAFAVSGCSQVQPYADSPQFNNERGRFEHPSAKNIDKPFSDLLRWRREAGDLPPDPRVGVGFETRTPQPEEFENHAVWLGHSTLLVSYNGQRVLTDPIFGTRASPVSFAGPKRETPLPIDPTQLPSILATVISHNHYDHLDKASVQTLARLQPDMLWVVPLGLKPLLSRWGAPKVVELDWWQSIAVNGVRLTATPVQHWSARTLRDRNQTLWAGWMVDWSDFKFYFAGDTGYSNDFNETRQRLGAPDLAAIPIGAYEPRWFMKDAHVNPEESVQVFQDLQAQQAIGIHWGTFVLTDEPMEQPLTRLMEALTEQGIDSKRFQALKHGGALALD